MEKLRLFDPTTQFQTRSGALNVAGRLRVFLENTDYPAEVFGDDGEILTQPVILDANGRANGLFVWPEKIYRLEVYDSQDALLFTIGAMAGGTGGGGGGTAQTITSSDGSIVVTPTANGVDLSVSDKKKFTSVLLTKSESLGSDGSFVFSSRIGGTGDAARLENGSIVCKAGWYHFAAQMRLEWTGTPSNSNEAVSLVCGNAGISETLDMSISGDSWACIAGDVEITEDGGELSFVCKGIPQGAAAILESVSVHSISEAGESSGGGGGGGENDKVAAKSGTAAGYLSDVLKSDSDSLEFNVIGNQMRASLNLSGESDPKIATCDEANINSATSNYGGYALKSGYERLEWENTQSFEWCNANIHQAMRLSEAQGTIMRCNVTLAGSLSGERPCLNVGIFDLSGNLLGSTGLKFYGDDFDSGVQQCSFVMKEAFSGALSLKRNTRYIIQAWTCGVQLAALSRGGSYNYNYDFVLRQNLTTSTSEPAWKATGGSGFSKADEIPYISMGAADLSITNDG